MNNQYTIFELENLNIETIGYEEFIDFDQLEEGKQYVIGLHEDHKWVHGKTCHTFKEQKNYILKLQRIFGINSQIMISGCQAGSINCAIKITNEDIETDGELDSINKERVGFWATTLRRGRSLDNPLVIMASYNDCGLLVVNQIN